MEANGFRRGTGRRRGRSSRPRGLAHRQLRVVFGRRFPRRPVAEARRAINDDRLAQLGFERRFMTTTRILVVPTSAVPAQAPAFEVASIRENRDGSVPQKFDWQPGGRVTVTAYPLFQLIRIAYNSNSIQTEGQIVGGPSWLKSDRFDLVAKANGSLDADETGRPTLLIAMLRSLLEDRFHVRVHTELRDALVYFLALARTAGSDRSCVDRRRRIVAARLEPWFRRIPRTGAAGVAAEPAATRFRASPWRTWRRALRVRGRWAGLFWIEPACQADGTRRSTSCPRSCPDRTRIPRRFRIPPPTPVQACCRPCAINSG